MPFQKGQSGNPSGRKPNRPWREALMLVSTEMTADGRHKLRALADECWRLALSGEMGAIKEIADRLDGRPPQQIEVRESREAGAPEDYHIEMFKEIGRRLGYNVVPAAVIGNGNGAAGE